MYKWITIPSAFHSKIIKRREAETNNNPKKCKVSLLTFTISLSRNKKIGIKFILHTLFNPSGRDLSMQLTLVI